jgi:hypothetical protein
VAWRQRIFDFWRQPPSSPIIIIIMAIGNCHCEKYDYADIYIICHTCFALAFISIKRCVSSDYRHHGRLLPDRAAPQVVHDARSVADTNETMVVDSSRNTHFFFT